MPKVVSKEEFIKRLYKINRNVAVIGYFKNMTTKILCKCLVDDCNHQWSVTPHKLLCGDGCPMCGKKSRIIKQTKSYDQFVKEVKQIHSNIEIIGKYKNSTTKIQCICIKHNHKFEMLPSNILKGEGCSICSTQRRAESRRKKHDQFVSQMQNINPNIMIIDEYKGSKIKIKCKCLIDNNIFYAQPSNLLSGCGCPVCKISKGEKNISNLLCQYNIKYISQYRFDDCKYIRPLPFDFYLPEYNMCIEYDGVQHYAPVRFGNTTSESSKQKLASQQKKDEIKNTYCQTNNIKLLRIPYWEFDNIEHILKDALSFGI